MSAPYRNPANWIDLALALVMAALTYGAAAPEATGQHVHLPAWAWVLLGLAAVGLRVVHRWFDAREPVAVATGPLTRDDPPRAAIGPYLVLLLAASLLAPGCAAALDCTRQLAGPQLLHVGDEVLDQADAARAGGVSADSAAWGATLARLAGQLGACVLGRAATDLLGHLDAPAAPPGAVALPGLAVPCERCHHAHAPRAEHRAYLERAARLIPTSAPARVAWAAERERSR